MIKLTNQSINQSISDNNINESNFELKEKNLRDVIKAFFMKNKLNEAQLKKERFSEQTRKVDSDKKQIIQYRKNEFILPILRKEIGREEGFLGVKQIIKPNSKHKENSRDIENLLKKYFTKTRVVKTSLRTTKCGVKYDALFNKLVHEFNKVIDDKNEKICITEDGKFIVTFVPNGIPIGYMNDDESKKYTQNEKNLWIVCIFSFRRNY